MIGSERFFKPSNLCSLENSLWVQCFSFPRIVLIGLDPAYIFTSSKAPFTQALQKHTCSLTHMLLNSSSIFTGSMHHSFQEAAQRNIFTKYMSASGGISPSHRGHDVTWYLGTVPCTVPCAFHVVCKVCVSLTHQETVHI